MKRLTVAAFVLMFLVASVAGAGDVLNPMTKRAADEPFSVDEQHEWVSHEAFVKAGYRCATDTPDEAQTEQIESLSSKLQVALTQAQDLALKAIEGTAHAHAARRGEATA